MAKSKKKREKAGAVLAERTGGFRAKRECPHIAQEFFENGQRELAAQQVQGLTSIAGTTAYRGRKPDYPTPLVTSFTCSGWSGKRNIQIQPLGRREAA